MSNKKSRIESTIVAEKKKRGMVLVDEHISKRATNILESGRGD